MSVFTITPSTSIFGSGTAFSGDSAGADSLTVQANAHLITDGAFAAASLAATGAWTVKVHGNIVSTGDIGLWLRPGNAGVSSITIGAAGGIGGSKAAIEAASAANISNAGTLIASSTTTGTTDGGALVLRGAGAHNITNTGLIEGYDSGYYDIAIRDLSTGGVFSLINAAGGTINGDIILASRNATVRNSGGMQGDIASGAGDDVLINHGTLFTHYTDFGEGTNRLVNDGIIRELTDLFITFGNGSDRLENSGSITEENGNGIGSQIRFGDGSNVLENSGTISVNDIHGGTGVDRIVNPGAMLFRELSLGAGNDVVSNTGEMSLTWMIDLGGGNNTLTNRGVISPLYTDVTILGGADADTVTNYGSIGINIDLLEGVNKLTNSGEIAGEIRLGVSGLTSTSTLTNTSTGVITGDIAVPGGILIMTNNGMLNGSIGTAGIGSFSPGNDRLVNRGTITGSVYLGYGANTVTNAGTIGSDDNATAYYSYTSSLATNTFTNYEVVNNVKTSGIVHGFIAFGRGDDRFFGGENAEKVWSGAGDDDVTLAGGDDLFLADETFGLGASTARDTIDGGDGSDTYDAFNLPPALTANAVSGGAVINIDTVKHTVGAPFSGQTAAIAAGPGIARGEAVGIDRIFNFEHVIATDNDDVVFGNALANIIRGMGASDIAFGYDGNDTIDGGAGADFLIGGRGRDTLTGGSEADVFIFTAANQSGVTPATRDLITDFQGGLDQIYLNTMDANTANGSGSNENFTFIGNNVAFAANTPGTLRTVWTATGYLVEGNTDNDIDAEFSIEIYDPTHSLAFDATYFNF